MKLSNYLVLPSACLTLALMLSGCGDKGPAGNQGKQGPAPAVAVEIAHEIPFTRTLALTGTVEPTRVATLSSPAEGPVMDCTLREGDRVEAGQTLLQIGRDQSALAALNAAREEEERQEREFERVRALVENKALASEQLDIAQSNLENARAARALAEQVSSDYQIAAPWAGLVSRLHVADGKYVGPRAPLVDLFDPLSLVLRFQVPEQFANKIYEGSQLTATFDALPNETFELPIVRAYPELDRRLRMRTYEAALPLQQQAFQPGFFGRITARLKSLQSALTVPIEAVRETADKHGVILLVEDGTAIEREVFLGFEEGGRIWIREGLQAGDKVIVRGMGNVRSGAEVRVAAAAGKPTQGER